jgi:hypothetical protein
MPTFTVGGTTVAAANAAPYATFGTTAARRAFIREVGLFCTAATASSIGLGNPGNTPAPTTTIVPNPHDAADASSTATLGTAWTVTPPTVPAVYDRKVTLGAAIGSGVIWKLSLDERIIIAKSAFKVFWNHGAGAGSALDMYIEYDE